MLKTTLYFIGVLCLPIILGIAAFKAMDYLPENNIILICTLFILPIAPSLILLHKYHFPRWMKITGSLLLLLGASTYFILIYLILSTISRM